MSCSSTGLDSCGCCEHTEEPGRYNRAGLPSVAYRLGGHSAFLRAMREQISLVTLSSGIHSGARPLAALGTRQPDDPSMALLDSAAVMLDVLTFYQERIVNEGFLGTATERLSVLEMARSIGYELSPGVAADVTLVFALDETPGKAPSRAEIPARTKVQSLPADGDLPQTFETARDFTAFKAWNLLHPRSAFEQQLSITASGTLRYRSLSGASTSTSHIALVGTSLRIEPSHLLLAHLDGDTTILRVSAVDEDLNANRTTLTVSKPAEAIVDMAAAGGFLPGAFAFSFIGPVSMTDTTIANVLANEYSESDLQILLEDRGWNVDDFVEAVNPSPDDPVEPVIPDAIDGVFVLRQQVGLFGHLAQPYLALPVNQREGEYASVKNTTTSVVSWVFLDPPYPEPWDNNTIWQHSQGGPYPNDRLYLEREVDDVLDTGWIVLDGETATARELKAYRIDTTIPATLAEYGMTGKVTGLELSDPDGTSGPTTTGFLLRKTTAHVASEWLALADLEINTSVEKSTIELDRMVLGMAKDQKIIVSGSLANPQGVVGTEVATIEEVTHHHGRTTLTFKADLANDYVRQGVTIQANVVAATHGETVEQPLGSGDGSLTNQSFNLRTAPLTYISSSHPSGREPTLELRVDGRLWDEVRSLYGRAPADPIYTVRIADDETATVTLGDGLAGARLATGTENITARYRTGIGPAGDVDADTIQLLMTRPPGVKSVNNPLRASGSEAPETFATARQNAPMTVRTLDRVVSLTDFEDFAATFAGIGKARADVLRLHAQRVVHLTVGSSSGGAVSADKITKLITAINNARDPGEAVCISTYRPLSFDLTGWVKTDPTLVHDLVIEAVRAALEQSFAFPSRGFAQGASVAEIMHVIHSVGGVIAADIDSLEVKGGPATTVEVPPLGIMVARPARISEGATVLGCNSIEAADLLLINRNGINLGVMP